MLVAISFMLYEWHTSSTELSKYERSTELLKTLEPLVGSKAPEISDSAKSIVLAINDIVGKSDITSSLEFSLSPQLAQSFFAMLPWIVFFILYIPIAVKDGKGEAYNAVVGFSIIICIVGSLAYFIPTEWSKWVRYGGVQAINFIIFMFFAYIGNKK